MGVPPRRKPEVLKLLPSLLGVLHNYKVRYFLDSIFDFW
jgi:hypothetical protein